MKWTKLEDVERAIQRFLTEEGFPQAIVLSGNWGVGKTFLWNKIAKESSSHSRPNYAYVSLFGVSSLEDLKFSLFEAVTDWPDNRESERNTDSRAKVSRSSKTDGWWHRRKLDQLTGSEKSLVGKFATLKDLPFAKQFEPLLRTFAFNSVADTVVCIDDFERRGQGLRPIDVLGLASYLRESRNCKVVLIHNEDALADDRDEFDRFEEKVFDSRIVLNPKPEFSIRCVVPISDEHFQVWIDYANLLRANNIRIIRRTYEQVRIVEEYFPNSHPDIRKQFIYSLLVSNFAKFGNLPHLPDLDYLRSFGNIVPVSAEESDEKEKLWQETMYSLQWLSTDELDMELMEVVENGYVTIDSTKAAIDGKTKYLEDAEGSTELEAAWRLYHATLQDNGEEIAAAVELATSKHLSVMSLMNTDQSIRLLRDLGHETAADKLANAFVELHKDDKSALDVENSAFGDELKDRYFLDRLSDALLNVPVEKDLEEVLERLARDKGWGGSDEEFLSNLEETDYLKFFTDYAGNNMSTILKGATQFSRISNPSDRMQDISAKIARALESVAATSSLNARRLERFGIRPKPDEQPPE